MQDVPHVVVANLTDIMNSSLKYGKVPTTEKRSRVTAIFNAGDSHITSNYRPISIIPVVMKVFERSVNIQLTEFVRGHSSMCENQTIQTGFRQGHSTYTALLDITDTILSNMDKGLLTGTVYMDLKKAFDVVDYATLLIKLNKLGVQCTELCCLDREQCV